jgi:hypothetical protein
VPIIFPARITAVTTGEGLEICASPDPSTIERAIIQPER